MSNTNTQGEAEHIHEKSTGQTATEDLEFKVAFRETFTSDLSGLAVDKSRMDLREMTLARVRREIEASVESEHPDDQQNNATVVYSYASLRLLHTYATLNHRHSQRIRDVIKTINEYANDESLSRPLTFLLLAAPGSGKSQLVRSIADRITPSRAGLASFNMATMQAKDDLSRVIDAARNIVVDRKLPLIFLDEFDSREAHYPLLLPLLWDGELDVLNRDLRLGRSIFFLAGSRPSLPTRLNHAREMSNARGGAQEDDKLLDLFSRINGGVIDVPSLNDMGAAADKIVIAMQLLRHRFTVCDRVPRSLLWFISKAHFRYEARSIATMVNLIRVGSDARSLKALTSTHLDTLPFHDTRTVRGSSLAFHLVDAEHADGLIDLWTAAKRRKGDQQIRHPLLTAAPLDTEQWLSAATSLLAKGPEPAH
jgi:hypothetical protein